MIQYHFTRIVVVEIVGKRIVGNHSVIIEVLLARRPYEPSDKPPTVEAEAEDEDEKDEEDPGSDSGDGRTPSFEQNACRRNYKGARKACTAATAMTSVDLTQALAEL